MVSGSLLAAIMPGLGSTPVTSAASPTKRQACAATRPVPTPTSSTFMPHFKPARISAGLKSGMKVLDVGVGTGLVAAQACLLTGDAARVTGVDPSPGMLASSRLPE